MKHDELKRLRTLVPGTLVLFFFSLPIYFLNSSSFARNVNSAAMLTSSAGIAFIIGLVYYSLKLRDLIIGPQIVAIQINIKEKLFSLLPVAQQTPHNRNILFEDRFLIDLFYEIVDNDKSLSIRSSSVRTNGAAWTSLADLALIGTVSSIWSSAVGFYARLGILFELATAELLISAFVLILVVPKIEQRHMELSNEQLDFIKNRYSDRVQQEINNRLGTES